MKNKSNLAEREITETIKDFAAHGEIWAVISNHEQRIRELESKLLEKKRSVTTFKKVTRLNHI